MTIVRKYKSEDFNRVVALINGSKEGITPYHAFEDHESLLRIAVKDENFQIFVIIDKEEIMGFGILRFNGKAGSENASGMIYDVFVEKGNRGKGLGRILLYKLMGVCKENGYTIIRLMVNADNESAVRLYKSVGFMDRRIEMTYEY